MPPAWLAATVRLPDRRRHRRQRNPAPPAGARNFLIPNIFDLATVPEGGTYAAFNTAAAIAANKALGEFLQLEELFPRIHITKLNSFDLFQAV